MINNLFYDYGYKSINKYNETLCGDHIEIVCENNELKVLVLADGLGSGVKANILSILTSKTIATMFANDIGIEESVRTIAKILPVCNERKIAYSTFTIIRVLDNQLIELVEYDNPETIVIRDGKSLTIPKTCIEIDNKKVFLSKFYMKLGDILLSMSDGAIHAGIGKNMNFGWERKDIIKYFLNLSYDKYSARTLSNALIDKCLELYGNVPGDDTSFAVIKLIERKSVNLVIGPPLNKADDRNMMSLFFHKNGVHIICGGTTASIASAYLNKPINCDLNLNEMSKDIPPISSIEGVDLVTEGVLTINKVLSNVEAYSKGNDNYFEWNNKNDGASLVTQLLINDSTDINFYVGKAINPAHQNPDLHINFNIKMKLIEELSIYLKKIGKRINVSYF